MKILVLNCGSSSIKYKLFDMTTKEILAQGGIEKIGLVGSFLKLTLPNGEKKILEKDIPEHTAGIEFILNTLVSPEYGAIKSLEEINAVGHRMVHGGERFSESVKLDKEVLDAFAACNDLAPLHNPANLKRHSIKQCPTMHICMPSHTNCMKNTVYVVTASTEPLIAMFQSAYAISWESIPKVLKSSLATLVTVVLSQLSRMVNV